MIKLIKDIIKYTVIIAVGMGAIYALLWFLGIIDYSLFKWASALFKDINWRIQDIFNYPNTWILISYILGRDLIFLGLDLLLKRGKRV